MKLRAVGLSIAAIAIVTNGACGGAKDSGLFAGGTDAGTVTVHDANAPDQVSTGGDDQGTNDASPNPGPDGDVADVLSPPDDASTGIPVTPCPAADPSVGVVEVTVGQTTYALGNSTWSQSGQNGADSMTATWGSQCDGQVDLTTFNHAGTFDVDTRMSALADGPRITFRPQGTEYVAGFDLQNACNPCGSGTITVSAWANGNVSGSFDVLAKKVGSGQTRNFTGTFSFHK